MKRPEQAPKGGVTRATFPEKGWESKHPRIMEYLMDTEYDDGAPRAVAALSLFVEDGQCKAAMNDKDLRRSCYISASTLLGALDALEAVLANETAPWRPWNQSTKKK